MIIREILLIVGNPMQDFINKQNMESIFKHHIGYVQLVTVKLFNYVVVKKSMMKQYTK